MLSTYQSKIEVMERNLQRSQRESDSLREQLAGTDRPAIPEDAEDAYYRWRASSSAR